MNAKRREGLILVGAGLAAAAAGFALGPMLSADRGNADLWSTPMPDLAGKERQLREWQGRIVVCNFWATWCAPCLEEIPLLVESRTRHAPLGLEVVGIAIDKLPKIAEFVVKFAIPYPILVPGPGGVDMLKRAGNPSGGLPFTLISDRRGQWVQRKLGALQAPELEGFIKPLLTAG